MFTAAYDWAAFILTTNFPSEVSKVASQTDVLAMQSGGAFVNQTIRLVVPFAGGHTGATATLVSGKVAGGGDVVVVVVFEVAVAEGLVVPVGDLAAFLGLGPIWMSTTMRMIPAATAARVAPRLFVERRLRCFWMIACFSARNAR